MIRRMEDRPFRVGDRVEWVGPSVGPPPHFPRCGERGWLVDIHPMDDIVQWDECWDDAGDFTTNPYVRRVGTGMNQTLRSGSRATRSVPLKAVRPFL